MVRVTGRGRLNEQRGALWKSYFRPTADHEGSPRMQRDEEAPWAKLPHQGKYDHVIVKITA